MTTMGTVELQKEHSVFLESFKEQNTFLHKKSVSVAGGSMSLDSNDRAKKRKNSHKMNGQLVNIGER